jgi:hypothetical protein
MTIHGFKKHSPEKFNCDLTGFYALSLSIIRFAVKKYGGTLETDPVSGCMCINMPPWSEDACRQELWGLLGPGKPLNAFLTLLVLDT